MVENTEKHNIYIVFSATSCKMGRFIRCITGNKYNHVSISIDASLSSMYSFARYYRNTPFYGGFVHESPLRYELASVKICALPLSNAEYSSVINLLSSLIDQKEEYIYNLFSAIFFPIKRQIHIDRAFTCSEFVNYVLFDRYIKRFCSISDLENRLKDYVIYEGQFLTDEYANVWGDDHFNEQKKISYAITESFSNVATLFGRKIHSGLH